MIRYAFGGAFALWFDGQTGTLHNLLTAVGL